ncbi:PaaI family thioesterase [Marmoricola sp. RAF53]|uniref:PaaI family thioesterase n=1 Tax=Marmoricola sp. RAF53 TaxID=3233059 RepID=UPI003F9647CF
MTDAHDPHADGPTPGPYSRLLGFRYVGVDEHEAVVEADPGPEHCNGGGIVHGGFLASLLDTTTGWAVHARVPEGVAAPHVQLSVQYVRAAVPGVPLVCRGRATGVGRRIGSTEAEITQGGRLVARAVGSHAVLGDLPARTA